MTRQIDLEDFLTRNKAALDKARAEKEAQQPLRPTKPQNFDLDGLALFGDGHKQQDLFTGKLEG